MNVCGIREDELGTGTGGVGLDGHEMDRPRFSRFTRLSAVPWLNMGTLPCNNESRFEVADDDLGSTLFDGFWLFPEFRWLRLGKAIVKGIAWSKLDRELRGTTWWIVKTVYRLRMKIG